MSFTFEPVFEKDEVVICVGSRGYFNLTTGAEYKIIRYEPEEPVEGIGFTWPAYVVVLGDDGRYVHCHANRFVKKETDNVVNKA